MSISAHPNEMGQNLGSALWRTATEYLLDCPEAGVVESFREPRNVRRRNVFVLLRPCAARQLVRLNGGKDWEVEQRDLVGQLFGRNTQRTANDGVQLCEVRIRWETVGLFRCRKTGQLNCHLRIRWRRGRSIATALTTQ